MEMEKKMVEVVESNLVPPNEETPKHSIWLSNLDFNVTIYHIPVVYIYRSNGRILSVEALKAALANALVPFYPFAGRLGVDRDDRTTIECNGEGALFAAARSDRTIDELLGDFAPSPEMELLVPSPVTPGYSPRMLLMTQVTFFKCGGVALGTAVHHVAADGFGSLAFINHWCKVARGDVTELDIPPFFDRTALRARSPPNPELFNRIRDGYHLTAARDPEAPFGGAILKLSEDQVALIKRKSGQHSTFQAISAYTWRCACLARRLRPDQVTRLYTIVSIRTILDPALPPGYLGNAVCKIAAVATAADIVSSAVEFGAQKMKDAIGQVTDEYVRSLIDYIELRGKGERRRDRDAYYSGLDMFANSWLRLPFHRGLGKPEFVGKATSLTAGHFYTMSLADGGVSVNIGLEVENMERFKKVFYQELEK